MKVLKSGSLLKHSKTLGLTLGMLFLIGSSLSADTATAEAVAATVTQTVEPAVEMMPQVTGNIMWLVLTAALVFFMQAGFAMVEGGMTRSKNSCNIMMKNLLDFCFGSLAFFAIGYALMFGQSGNSIIGWDSSLVFLSNASAGQDNSTSAMWFFQAVFAATAATIVSGAMAERTKFSSYLIYSVFISIVIYPITGHWIWGGGWLGVDNFRDFAGSTVVHSIGAWCALAGVIVVGARKGKYGAKGETHVIPGHNLPMSTLGVFILWFGWYGFNCGSTLAAVGGLAHVATTTTLAASAGACMATLTTWLKFGKPDLSMALNGTLAGLVAITAPCASVSAGSAVIIGLVAGALVVFSCVFIERKLKLDDPVGAISVHGVCGAWGTIAVGLFGQRAIDVAYWSDTTAIKDGLFYGGGFSQFGLQVLGVATCFAFAFGMAFILFSVIKATIGLRVSEQEEMEGLDIGEHGNEAYADFAQYRD